MASIRREYDDSEVLAALQNETGLGIPEARWVDDIDVEYATSNSSRRVIEVKLRIPVTTAQFAKIFKTPTDVG